MVFDRLCGHGEDKLRHQFTKWDRQRGTTRTLSAFTGLLRLSLEGGGVRMLMSTLLYESLCPLLYMSLCMHVAYARQNQDPSLSDAKVA